MMCFIIDIPTIFISWAHNIKDGHFMYIWNSDAAWECLRAVRVLCCLLICIKSIFAGPAQHGRTLWWHININIYQPTCIYAAMATETGFQLIWKALSGRLLMWSAALAQLILQMEFSPLPMTVVIAIGREKKGCVSISVIQCDNRFLCCDFYRFRCFFLRWDHHVHVQLVWFQ